MPPKRLLMPRASRRTGGDGSDGRLSPARSIETPSSVGRPLARVRCAVTVTGTGNGTRTEWTSAAHCQVPGHDRGPAGSADGSQARPRSRHRDQAPTSHHQGSGPSRRRLDADRLARPELPPGCRARDVRARPAGHRGLGVPAQHARPRAHPGPQPHPRRRRLRPRLLRAVAHPDGLEQQAAAMGYSMSLTLIHRPETDDVEPCSQPRRAPGGRRHLGHPRDRRQPGLVCAIGRRTCPSRWSSWAA